MADQSGQEKAQEEWVNFVTQMNEQLLDTIEASAQAQSEFVESWFDSVESLDEELLSEGMEGYAQAYEVWMDAAQDSVEKMSTSADGEDVSPNEFRDVWLNAANEAFKEVITTEAFASVTGQAFEDALELRQTANENAQSMLHEVGLATEGDAREIAERLAALERRQKRVEQKLETVDAVEQKLDRVLDHLEDQE